MNKTMKSFLMGLAFTTVVLVVVVLFRNYKTSPEEDPNIEEGNAYFDEENDGTEDEDIIVEIEEDELAIGSPAPDFTLKNLEGEDVSLSDYKGKIVIINFWATWCKFCDIEMPDLDNLNKENDDVVVLAVDVLESESKVKKYIEKGGYEFDVVLDTKGKISRQYQVSAYPTTYAVDKEGILMGGVPGMMSRPQMDQIVESVRESQ